MNNTVEFIVKMRDLMSGGLGRLSSTSQSSFARMSTHQQQLSQRNNLLSMSFDQMQQKIQQVERTIRTSTIPSQIAEARRELAALQRQSSMHPGSMGGGRGSGAVASGGGLGIGGVAIGSMLGGMATNAAGMIMTGIGTALQKSIEKEQAITGLSTFLGKEGANEAYKNIRKDADATPFDTESLLMVNRSLISAGLNAKSARADTLNLSNAIAAVGGGNAELSRMAANMQQIKTVGKATAMDIRQFGMVGINIYEMLAKSTGKSIAQVKEMDVSYDDLAKSLAMAHAKGGIYEGALEAQSKTRGGKWNTVMDKLGNAGLDLLDRFSPFIDRVLDGIIQIADGMDGWITKASPFLEMLNIGFIGIFNWVSDIVSMLWNIAAPVLNFLKNSELFRDVLKGIAWIFATFGEKVKDAMVMVQIMWEKFVKPMLGALEMAYRFIKGGGEVKATRTTITKKPDDKKSSPFDIKTLSDSNAASGKQAAETVSGGGPKTVNIHIGKFMDSLQFTTMTSGETLEQLEKIIMECMARVVYNGSKLV